MRVKEGDMFQNRYTGVVLQYLLIDGKHYNKCIKEDNYTSWRIGEVNQMDEESAKLFLSEDGWAPYYEFSHYLKQAELL